MGKYTLDDLMKGPIASATPSAPKSDKKVFYVLSTSSGQFYNPAPVYNYRQYTQPLSSAARFASVTEVLNAIQDELVRVREEDVSRGFTPSLKLSGNFKIVRVEETSRPEQRVVLGETQGAPLGAKVKYMIVGTSGGNNGRVGLGTTIQWNQSLDAATLFGSQGEAISALKAHPYGGSFNVVRVAVTAASPTLTETVLS